MKKRTYRSEKEKAKIALEALDKTKTMSEVAKRNKISSVQVGKWRGHLVSEAHRLFQRGKSTDTLELEEENRILYEKIGRLVSAVQEPTISAGNVSHEFHL